jgi:hypothetical protein
MVIHKPKFGGKPKTANRPPNKKANEMLGGAPHRQRAQDIQATMDKGLGNVETGFIQNTPKKATAAMMGRAPPPMKMKSTRKKTGPTVNTQFMPKAGRKVF